jgi:hypothetical protein
LRCDAYVKHIVSEKLGAKSYKNKFVWYLKKLLDIIYIIQLRKKYMAQNMLHF